MILFVFYPSSCDNSLTLFIVGFDVSWVNSPAPSGSSQASNTTLAATLIACFVPTHLHIYSCVLLHYYYLFCCCCVDARALRYADSVAVPTGGVFAVPAI
jgi:hypothetical protein